MMLKQRSIKTVIIVFLVICSIFGILCTQYYKQVQNTIRNESSGYLQEISEQMGNNISRIINDNFSALESIASVLRHTSSTAYDQLKSIISEQRNIWNYKNILLIGTNGIAYNSQGMIVPLVYDEYLRDTLINRKPSISISQIIDATEYVLFSIPIEGVQFNGAHISAISAQYELSTLDRMLYMTAFDQQAYAHVIQKDGTIIIRSSAENAAQSGYNFLNTLSEAILDKGYSIQQFKSDIQNSKSGMISYTFLGQHKNMIYTPLNGRDWCLLTIVPTAVINAESQALLSVTFFVCSMIIIIFTLLLGTLMVSSYKHQSRLEQIAYIDPITAGDTIQRFYQKATTRLTQSDCPRYALIYVNIEKFKILNEQFGRDACNSFLYKLHQGILRNLTDTECVGRIFADNFCVLIEYTQLQDIAHRFELWYDEAIRLTNNKSDIWSSTLVQCGIYCITEDIIPLPHMIDRAKLALKESTPHILKKIRYSIYDDKVRRQMFREKHLEDIMDDALRNSEFHVYLQPKYATDTEEVAGAEALVRWIRDTEGMIYPDEFISLFEKNGFIIQLDLWVFEHVCKTIRSWLDEGLTPIKISVNCSRVHIKIPSFLEQYRIICERHHVPPEYLEIELTENVVFEDVEYLTKIIKGIHEAGFACAMDDFGSGYSSLNLIKDIPVDTLKLDKIFFRGNPAELSRTESVVSSILFMSKALQMETVAEGVEERTQVDMLKRLGCDYIQGYYFARPMPIQDFEQLVFGRVLDSVRR